MVHIGNQTSCWAASATEPFDYALAQNFDAFEWFPDKKPDTGWDDSDLDGQTRRRIAETARAQGMRLSVHARWQANLLSAQGLALFWKDFELARDLGAALINIHLDHEQGLSAFLKAIAPLIQKTAEAGVQLSIENTPLHAPELFNELFAKLRALGSVRSSHVGMCLDLGHANLCAATRNDYLAFFDRLDPNLPLIHLHLHENWGDSDSHLPLFTGPSSRDDSGIRGFVTRLKQRNYSGSIVLEQWPHPPSLLNQARDRLVQLWQLDLAAPTPSPDGEAPTPRQTTAPKPSEQDMVTELVEGDRTRRSWREKLDFVRHLLARGNPAVTSDQLIDIAIYLRFLGTGEIACAEDGRHFRPTQHARLSSQIQDRLAKLTTPGNQFIVRRIYPWLPASSPTFQRPEPLTRIRDIAHRNDIPQDLKREIKTTLQNKLHRCAGPEDLLTSTGLLERITAPGMNYSVGFVEQFKIFHEELKEFFNAQSLEQRLTAVAAALNGTGSELIQQFLKQKGSLPIVAAGGAPAAPPLMGTFSTLTDLRRACLELVAQKPGAQTEAVLLADIALEDFAFVLLSEIINACDRPDASSATRYQTDALTLALQNLILSGVDLLESTAVENELKEWGAAWQSANRNQLLRLKATLLRSRRVAEIFGDRVVALFSARAGKLGRALGVDEQAIRVFSEADIRSHIVFQVSKLATSLLRKLRHELKSPPWDVLVPGKAVGRVTTVASFDQGEGLEEGPVIALLQTAAGDEEIPKNVTGIVLAHELPHLSHLAVRARQARVVFVACEEPSEFRRLQSLVGLSLALNATPDNVEWEKVDRPEPTKALTHTSAQSLPTVRLAQAGRCIPLEEATAQNSGGKAAGARHLAELARQSNAGFLTPQALVIPFGVMEEVLHTSPAIEAEYRRAIKELERSPTTQLQQEAARLRDLLQRLQVPDAIISPVKQQFHSPLIVRSSANAEDAEEFAGAGLYESVPNVPTSDVGRAIRTVWASLWTYRATLSRRETGIPHEQTHMAVLIQELLDSDFAFVLHTVNPVTRDPRSLYGEIVVGLGETLVAASALGEPYRFTCNKQSGSVDIIAFANFSKAAWPRTVEKTETDRPRLKSDRNKPTELSPSPPLEERAGARRPVSPHDIELALVEQSHTPTSNSGDPSPLRRGERLPLATPVLHPSETTGPNEHLLYETLDYSRITLSREPAALESLGVRLSEIGTFVEQALDRPQDIEGVVIQDKIYLVQTRPQQGL